jgi:hypothetical protein
MLQKEQDTSRESPQITPVTVAGVLDTFWSSAEAFHALYYRTPSRVFSGKDDFIEQARGIQLSQTHGVTFVDLNDRCMPENVQAWARYQTDSSQLISSTEKSPWHYRQGTHPDFAQYIVGEVLRKIEEAQQPTPQ